MSSREKADTADVDCHEIYSDFPVEETEEEKRILDQMTRRADGGAGLRNARQRLLPVGHRHSGSDRSRGGRGDHVGLYRSPWHLVNMVLADGPAPRKEGTDYYQYCTRIPSGTLLAQTFDLDLMEQMGRLVGEEMEQFHITLWLAPGMNIHRNPLCGRNFEYYSEDPCLTGKMAAAMSRGVQTRKGCFVTVKHFCCNNQEENGTA